MRADFSINCYQVLGVPRDAPPESIKQAYKSQALRWHPDKNPGDAEAEERIKRINEAWTILRDPIRRRLYDLMLNQATGEARAARAAARPGGGQFAPGERYDAGLRLFPWELRLIALLLRGSIWFFNAFRVRLTSPWFWAATLAVLGALFVLAYPFSIAFAILFLLVLFCLQIVLVLYLYIRGQMMHLLWRRPPR